MHRLAARVCDSSRPDLQRWLCGACQNAHTVTACTRAPKNTIERCAALCGCSARTLWMKTILCLPWRLLQLERVVQCVRCVCVSAYDVHRGIQKIALVVRVHVAKIDFHLNQSSLHGVYV